MTEQNAGPQLLVVDDNEMNRDVLSRRLVAAQGTPRYNDCYDLVDPSARQTAAWTAFTATPWSSRVRPNFRNTRRTIFARLPLPSSPASSSSLRPESDRP